MVDGLDRRERKKLRTRELIRETALQLFESNGYRDTTIRAIADAADVATRTVTLHFPAKEDILFSNDPFPPESLAARLQAREEHESTLDALRAWRADTMAQLEAGRPDDPDHLWRLRALRMRLIASDTELRGRARAAYYEVEQILAESIGEDLGLPSNALVPRLASFAVVGGLRELYEAAEAQRPDGRPSGHDLLRLVDVVIEFVRAGIVATVTADGRFSVDPPGEGTITSGSPPEPPPAPRRARGGAAAAGRR